MRKLFVVLVVGALLVVAMLVSRAASAQGPVVGATDETVDPGGTGTAHLYAHDFSAPGLGAWTVDIAYDPDVITITGCGPVEGTAVCNPEYAGDTIRSAGADAFGLEGDSVLAEIRFRCSEGGGTSPLDVQPIDVSDATVGGPVLLDVEVSDGSVTCEEGGGGGGTPTTIGGTSTPSGGVQGASTPVPAAPDAGTGSGTPEAPWQVLATLMALFSVGVMVVAGLRVFAQREG